MHNRRFAQLTRVDYRRRHLARNTLRSESKALTTGVLVILIVVSSESKRAGDLNSCFVLGTHDFTAEEKLPWLVAESRRRSASGGTSRLEVHSIILLGMRVDSSQQGLCLCREDSIGVDDATVRGDEGLSSTRNEDISGVAKVIVLLTSQSAEEKRMRSNTDCVCSNNAITLGV